MMSVIRVTLIMQQYVLNQILLLGVFNDYKVEFNWNESLLSKIFLLETFEFY